VLRLIQHRFEPCLTVAINALEVAAHVNQATSPSDELSNNA
jgi:hypothetical protein